MAEVNKLVVHNGVFHADDVLCAAMARAINPDVWIVRTRNVAPEDQELNGTNGIYVADVGGGKYDHHQNDAATREDGAKYAACGLLYNEWKDDLFNNKEGQKYFEDTYIKPIEQMDNGGERNMLGHAIGGLNPSWDSKTDFETAFYDAVDRMSEILEAERHRINDLHKAEPAFDAHLLQEAEVEINRAEFADPGCKDKTERNYMDLQTDRYNGETRDPLTAAISAVGEVHHEAAEKMVHDIIEEDKENVNSAYRARQIVKDAYEHSADKTSVVLDTYVPWQDVLPETEAEYVIYKTTNQYNIQCVPQETGSRETKAKLPEEWLNEKPEGCKFVHPGRHVSGFDTMEHAKAALDEILRERTANEQEAPSWENMKADFHLTLNNTDHNIDYEGFTVQPGFWYGEDLNNGDKVALTAAATFYRMNSDTKEWQDNSWDDPAWTRDDCKIKADGYQAPDFASKKPFDQWLEEKYGISVEEYELNYMGPQADRVKEVYEYYRNNQLPKFAQEEHNMQHAIETTGVDKENRPCTDWRWWNDHLQEHHVDTKEEIAALIPKVQEEIIKDQEEQDQEELYQSAEEIPAETIVSALYWQEDDNYNHRYNNVYEQLSPALWDVCKQIAENNKDTLLQWNQSCVDAGYSKKEIEDFMEKGLTTDFKQKDSSMVPLEQCNLTHLVTRDFSSALYQAETVELNDDFKDERVQDVIKTRPGMALQAIMEPAIRDCNSAMMAYYQSMDMETANVEAEHEAYLENLFTFAKEYGLSREDCEQIFGEDFVATMDEKELNEPEKEETAPNLE